MEEEPTQQSSRPAPPPMVSRRQVTGPLDHRFFLLSRQKQIMLLKDDLIKKKRDRQETLAVQTLLGEVQLIHNQECALYHGQDTCLARGCRWKTGGWFPSGQCVGPHLDQLQLSEPPRIKDIQRLDTIMKSLMAKTPASRTAEEDEQLFYLMAVKQYMIDQTEELQALMKRRAVLKNVIQEYEANRKNGSVSNWEAEINIKSAKEEDAAITEELLRNFKGMGSFVVSIGRAMIDFVASDSRLEMFREQDTLLSTAAVWINLLIEISKIYTGKWNPFTNFPEGFNKLVKYGTL